MNQPALSIVDGRPASRRVPSVLALLAATAVGCGTMAPMEASDAEPVAAEIPAVPLDETDAGFQSALERGIDGLGLGDIADGRRLGIALVDLTDRERPRYAAVNDDVMMYGASLSKLAVLLAAFEAIESGRMDDTPELRRTLTEMIRVSSNSAATAVIRRLGFQPIADVLESPRYRLYERNGAGGLWVGKAYDSSPAVTRDPRFGISHGATARQAARFLVMLDAGLLVSPEASRRMLEMLGDPGLHHKFVKGLEGRRDVRIFRKSGTYRQWHADAALIEHAGHRYVAAAIVEDPHGGALLERLIPVLDDIVVNGDAAGPVANR